MSNPEPYASAVYLEVLRELTTALAELKVAIDRYDDHGEARHKVLEANLQAVNDATQPLVVFVESERARREAQDAEDLIELEQKNRHEDKILDAEIAADSLKSRVLWGIVSAIGISVAGGLTAWFATMGAATP